MAGDVVDVLANKDVEKSTEHALEKFAPLLDPNPRSMKRFVMAYSMSRAIRSLEGSWVETEPLALWTILQIRWPELAERLQKKPTDIQFVKNGKGLPETDKLSDVFDDPAVIDLVNFKHGGPLTDDLIRECCGTANIRSAAA